MAGKIIFLNSISGDCVFEYMKWLGDNNFLAGICTTIGIRCKQYGLAFHILLKNKNTYFSVFADSTESAEI